uniref:Uncharacterized protein n=1 Tax=Paramoeba aestuarina TaxID=180227 RepID=A0A7S4PL64_9EUKA|mmetsp:Transcript_819/g.1381  ORF Transcript_819/g.1381 Transcript_819/m.1381 type:complete len:343 (+) Transcript_819:40-1068(+)
MSDSHYVENVEIFLESHFGKAVPVAAKKYILEHFLYRIAESLGVISGPLEHETIEKVDRDRLFTKFDGYPVLKDLEEFHSWLKKAPHRVKQSVESALSGPYGVTLVQILFDGLDSFLYHQKGNKGVRHAAKRVYGRVPCVTMSELRCALCLEAIQPEVIDEILYSQIVPVLRCHHEDRMAHFFTKRIRESIDPKDFQPSGPQQRNGSLATCKKAKIEEVVDETKGADDYVNLSLVFAEEARETSLSLKRLQLKQHHIMHIPDSIHHGLFVRPGSLDKDTLKKYRLPITMRSTKWEMKNWYDGQEIRQIAREICKVDSKITAKRAVEKLFYHFKRETDSDPIQ